MQIKIKREKKKHVVEVDFSHLLPLNSEGKKDSRSPPAEFSSISLARTGLCPPPLK